MDLSADNLRQALLFVIAFVMCTSVHEFGHAWVANRLGDPTPRSQGRLTLLPTAHVDPIGTLLFPFGLALMGLPVLGWGKPVYTVPSNFTRRVSRRTGNMLVSVAGPLMNLVMATVVTLLLVPAVRFGLVSSSMVGDVFRYLIVLNLFLLVLNLLPIPPLDGGKVLAWALPRSMQNIVDHLERWGTLILLGLFITNAINVLLYPAFLLTGAWQRAFVALVGA